MPVQRSNAHGNGEGLSGDAQLGSQSRVQKALIAPRVDEDLERFRGDKGKMGNTWRGVETITKTGETVQGVTVQDFQKSLANSPGTINFLIWVGTHSIFHPDQQLCEDYQEQ